MTSNMTNDIFDEIIELPDPKRQHQFTELIGLDSVKEFLLKEGKLLLYPDLLDEWSKKHHGKILPAVKKLRDSPPLILFYGDVGTGKTTLAESFGDPIAREYNISVRVAKLSLKARGSGAVGEMTKLITRAFEDIEQLAHKEHQTDKKVRSAAILIIDEADALAQSREFDQMHHEDRAGVNALIRGIDKVASKHLPILVVICTNRVEAIDPAVMRRASIQFSFERPNAEQRFEALQTAFDGVFDQNGLKKLAELTGPNEERQYGYTYSDLTQRLIPSVILKAFPDGPITFENAKKLSQDILPTRPFNHETKKL